MLLGMVRLQKIQGMSGCPIGIFDSGYGGLTILRDIRRALPQYDYLYLGDNARSPYGTRSFEVVYEYTWQCVKWLFDHGCRLVILACNTASAKALRTIQQNNLGQYPDRRVLGVIRPTTEQIGGYTRNNHVGLLATPGTVQSDSYSIEIAKFFPEIILSQQACPMFVPLIEYGEANSDGADYFVSKYTRELLRQDPDIDTVILGCTHYPMIYEKLRKALPANITILSQGQLVADSLKKYLENHKDIEQNLKQGANCRYCTTEQSRRFSATASLFMNETITAETVNLLPA